MERDAGKARTFPCPTCGKVVEWDLHQQWRPFCSERCRMIDLGKWLDETHRIPADEPAGAIDPDHPDQ